MDNGGARSAGGGPQSRGSGAPGRGLVLADDPPCLLAPNFAATGRRVVLDLSAVPLGRGNAGAHRAARRQTLALRIFNLLHYGHNPQVNALCLCSWRWRRSAARLGRLGGLRDARRRGRFEAAALAVLLLTVAGCSRRDGKVFPIQSNIVQRGPRRRRSRHRRGRDEQAARRRRWTTPAILYVVDMTARVQKFSPAAFSVKLAMMQTDRASPRALCPTALMATSWSSSRIIRASTSFSPDGKQVAQWGEPDGTNAGQLGMPRGAAVNSRGEICVCEYTSSERCAEVQPDGTKFLGGWGRLGDGPGEFNRAEVWTFDAQNRIYVAIPASSHPGFFRPTANFCALTANPVPVRGSSAIPRHSGWTRAACNSSANSATTAFRFSTPGTSWWKFLGGPGRAPGQFSEPWSIALDSKGNLYVADALNHRVQKFCGGCRKVRVPMPKRMLNMRM